MSAPSLSAAFAVSWRSRWSFWSVTGSVMETVKAVCPSMSSRKRTRFAQGSAEKSTMPFFIVTCRDADLRGVPDLGQIISTVRRLRETSSAFSGIEERESDFRVISTDIFMRLSPIKWHLRRWHS